MNIMPVKFTVNGVIVETATAADAARIVEALAAQDTVKADTKPASRKVTMRRVGGITLQDMVASVFDENDRALSKYKVHDIITRDYKGMYSGEIRLNTIYAYMQKMVKDGIIRRVGTGLFVRNIARAA